MSNFNGLVKAKKEDVESALNNWDKTYQEAYNIRKTLIERSKQETITTTFLWLFKKTQTKYAHMNSLVFNGYYWTVERAIHATYPTEFPYGLRDICDNECYFQDIKVMFDINPDEMYLSPEQAVKVFRWRNYDQT